MMLALALVATMMVAVEWNSPQPPPPPPYEPTAIEQAFGGGMAQTTDLVAHIYCTLSVTDQRDQWTACLSHGGIAFIGTEAILSDVIAAENATKPGGCILGVKAHSDGSTICAAWKAP